MVSPSRRSVRNGLKFTYRPVDYAGLMHIGDPITTYTVEPLVDPVPREEPAVVEEQVEVPAEAGLVRSSPA